MAAKDLKYGGKAREKPREKRQAVFPPERRARGRQVLALPDRQLVFCHYRSATLLNKANRP